MKRCRRRFISFLRNFLRLRSHKRCLLCLISTFAMTLVSVYLCNRGNNSNNLRVTKHDSRVTSQKACFPGSPVSTLSGIIPAWYFINMDHETTRRESLITSLHDQCNVSLKEIHRVPAVGGVRSDRFFVLPWASQRSTTFSLSDRTSRRIQIKTKKPRLAKEIGTLLSHIRAVRMAFDDGHPYAIIMEDDASFEYVSRWYKGWKVGLHEVLRALEEQKPSPTWDVCQLAYTWFSPIDIIKFAAHMIPQLMKGEVIGRRSPSLHRHLWSASTYIISRRGMKKLLDFIYPGGAEGPSFDSILAGDGKVVEFDLSNNVREALSDSVIYGRPLNAWYSTRPLFTYGTTTSNLHSHHLGPQEMSKQAVERLLFLHDVGLRDADWHEWYRKYSLHSW